MRKRGHRIPNGEEPTEGAPRAPVGGPRSGECPRAFLGNTQGDVACGVCRVRLQLGLRAVRFPCGQGRHVLHARYVVEALGRSMSPAPLRCPAVRCRAQHPRRDALEAALQADAGLRNRAARMGGGTAGEVGLRGLWYGWNQNSLGVGPPLDAASFNDLRQRFAGKVQP